MSDDRDRSYEELCAEGAAKLQSILGSGWKVEAAKVAAKSQAHRQPKAEQAGVADLPLFGTKTLL